MLQIAVSSSDVVDSLLALASSESTDVQNFSAHCLARFAAWQGVARQAISTPRNAEVGVCASLLCTCACLATLTPAACQ